MSSLVLSVICSFFGCWEPRSKLEKGFGYTLTPDIPMLAVRAQTDRFAAEDVTLELSIGLYDLDRKDEFSKEDYLRFAYEEVFFGIYVCEKTHRLDILNDMEISDYRTLAKHYFVREILEEEASQGDYGYQMRYGKGITYSHSEKITIPLQIFSENEGGFAIKVIAFCQPLIAGEPYYTSTARDITLDYEWEGEQIKIIF